jgi:hypothetical protein
MKSEYKKLAADVNRSGTLSALDVLEIKRVILGYQEKFRIPTWRFVPADYVFPVLDQNQVLPTPDSLLLPYLLDNQSDKNFIGIKAGDLNLSAAANPRNDKTLFLQIADKARAKGETFDLTFSAAKDFDLSALQTALHLDNTYLVINKIQNVDLEHFSENDVNMNQAENGNIRLAWTNPDVQKIAAKSNLFLIQCTALQDINSLKNIVALDEKTMPSIAYEAEQEQHIALEFIAEKAQAEANETSISIYPNPCDAAFTLHAPKANAATLFDAKGRVVARLDLLEKSTTTIETKDLPSGVYLLHIQAETEILTKKIMVLH